MVKHKFGQNIKRQKKSALRNLNRAKKDKYISINDTDKSMGVEDTDKTDVI